MTNSKVVDGVSKPHISSGNTIERINGVNHFEFQGVMITKTPKGWFTASGEKFDGRKVINFLKRGAVNHRLEVARIKSLINRLFDGSYTI